MGRSPCCSKEGLNRGAWTAHEDKILTEYIRVHGEGRWRNLPKRAGLKRCGKSCRLRWLNYFRPDIKRGNISQDEEELIIRLHKLLGNRWSLIAGRLPGRTDNEIKNYWNTNLGKKVKDSHQKNSTSSRKLPSQPNEKSADMNPKTPKPNNSPSPTPSMLEPHVVRTKATKCSRVFINPIPLPHHHSSMQFQNKSNAEAEAELAVPLLEDDPVNYINNSSSNQTEPNYYGFLSFANSTGAENFASDSLLMDFNMGVLCLSDLLNSADFPADDNLSDFRYSANNNNCLLLRSKRWCSPMKCSSTGHRPVFAETNHNDDNYHQSSEERNG